MTGSTSTGCGGGTCGCGSAQPPATRASVNGIALAATGEQVSEDGLRERAWSELLRQEAVRQGLLPAHGDPEAPALSAGDQRVIEAMLERSVPVSEPTEDECRRYYDGRRSQFVEGAQVRARHILFAVTAGVDVPKLAGRAEQALLALTRQGADFAQLARELSNCPSGAQGGDLGWFAPHECAPELARELFHEHAGRSLGLRPRLVHSRYGFHVIDVLERRQGRQAAFAEVAPRIAQQLAQQARAKALHLYMQQLAAAAAIQGCTLSAVATPLLQ